MRGAAALDLAALVVLGSLGAGVAVAAPPDAEPARPLPLARTLALAPVPTEPGPAAPGGLGSVGSKGPSFRLPGDSDSIFTLGGPSPTGQLRLLAAVEVNDVVLKAITPDPTIPPKDTRPRASGSWSPLDGSGRPYQLRLGARLVW